MTKWKYVIEWLFTSLIFHYGYSAYNISSDICLEKLLDFAFGDKGCKFTLAEAKQRLEGDKSVCPRKCHVKINNLEEKKWSLTVTYRLSSIDLSINGLIEDSVAIQRECGFVYRERRSLEINCKTDSKLWNLKVNETCQRDDQCSTVFGSICQNNTCVCKPGVVPLNDSEPVLDGNLQAFIQDKKDDEAVSVTIGAVFGSFILGIVLTVVVGNIYQRLRYRKFKTKECSRSAVFNNATYETEIDVLQNNPLEKRFNEKKDVNVSPFAHSHELKKNRNNEGDIKSSTENNDVNNDVYNHLLEKEENLDVDENYDHAHGNINPSMEESDYSNLNTGRTYMGSNIFAAEQNDYDDQEPVNDYCSLKQ
ncbi:uncharacterized protein LOC134262990 [Saccostrea cucullata]|uniref:uncharacterized protein LOC134262990 n=1 Tax=Saccostrea cuccullata TaxID=36930 RepID=UPI002ED3965C